MSEVDKLIQSERSKQLPESKKSDLDRQFEGEFGDHLKTLGEDIEHVNLRMAHINNFIVNLETQVNNLRALIANDSNSAKRGNYYTLMNTCVELNARYEDLYLKCMDLKYKYRKEFGETLYKVKRTTFIDVPKTKKEVEAEGDLSAVKLSQLLKDVLSKLDANDKATHEVLGTIKDLETDPMYKI